MTRQANLRNLLLRILDPILLAMKHTTANDSIAITTVVGDACTLFKRVNFDSNAQTPIVVPSPDRAPMTNLAKQPNVIATVASSAAEQLSQRYGCPNIPEAADLWPPLVIAAPHLSQYLISNFPFCFAVFLCLTKA